MSVEKVALVTAGGSGMGAGAARRLAGDGFKVGILSSSGKGKALAEELGGFGVTGSNQSKTTLPASSTGRRNAGAASMFWSTQPGTGPRARCWRSRTRIGTRGWTST